VKVAVVGGTGFVGRHVVRRLLEKTFEVVNIDKLSSEQLYPGEQVLLCDLHADDGAARAARDAGEIGGAVWLAATIRQVTSIDDSAEDDLVTMVEAPLAFLTALSPQPKVFVYISSIQVYGKPVTLPVDETHPTDPFTAYGVAKLCAEHYLRIACDKAGVRFVSLRLAFVYGPGQHFSNVIPKFLTEAAKHQSPIIKGDGKEIRDDVYVEDVADAVASAIEMDCSGTFNISSGQPHTLLTVANEICALTGNLVQPVVTPEKSDWVDRWYTVAKAEKQLNFKATPLEQGLRKTWQDLAKQV